MEKENHPYLHHFDDARKWQYLIIGTFPPNKEFREKEKSVTDYFYGNRGSLWNILQKIYPEYDFARGTRKELLERMKNWQEKYNVGITDTIVECSRKDISSANDSDLIIDWDGYNHPLKEYVLKNQGYIEKILFTSSSGCKSAYETFKIILNGEINKITKSKLIVDLPSPSGSSNTALFNVNNEDSLGLLPDFFEYIKKNETSHLKFFQERWQMKKQKLSLAKEKRGDIELKHSPKGLVVNYKIWKYKNALPLRK